MDEIRTRTRTLVLAVLAQVDHGKTTLLDRLSWAIEHGGRAEAPEDEVTEPDRPKRIRWMPASLELPWKDRRFHFLDVPIRYGAGRDLDRVLDLSDGVLWIVDAAEGPVPRTRLALHSTLRRGLPVFVVLNRIDLPKARPAEVLMRIKDELRDLEGGSPPPPLEPMYANALRGVCRDRQTDEDLPLVSMLDRIAERVPYRIPPADGDAAPLWFVSRLDFDALHGRIPVGRVERGTLAAGDRVRHRRRDGTIVDAIVRDLWRFSGLEREPVVSAAAGDVVGLRGLEQVAPGEPVCGPSEDPPEPRPVDEPAFTLRVSVSDSPLRESSRSEETEADLLRERLWEEQATNDKFFVEADGENAFRLSGRSELQLSMLLEMLRREGFELWVDRPRIRTLEVDGEVREPMEWLELDLPSEATDAVREELASRAAEGVVVEDRGSGRALMSCRIPARGLLGFREEFLSATGGTGTLGHRFEGWTAPVGGERTRLGGALVADRDGTCTPEALMQLQHRGSLFVGPGDEVYRNMIVGEHTQPTDVRIDPIKRGTDSGDDPGTTRWLVPPRSWTVEQAFQFLRGDEQLELGPHALRFRKRP